MTKRIMQWDFLLVLIGFLWGNYLFIQHDLLFIIFFVMLSIGVVLRWISEARLRSDQAVKVEQINKTDELTNEDERLIHSVIYELQQFIQQEIIIIEKEIKRAKNIVYDGVIGLSDSFKTIQSVSDEQQKLIQSFSAMSQRLMSEQTTLIDKQRQTINDILNITPNIHEAVSLGIRSLQFEDLTTQSLASLQMNINSLNEISDVLSTFDTTKNIQLHDQLIRLKATCRQVYDETKKKEDTRSVKQLTMDEGEVDLF